MSGYLIDETKIILYGTGGLSCKVEELFRISGGRIEGYIDRRAKDIQSFHDKPVYSIDDAESKIIRKEEYVVIITTKNVFEHSKIAAQLRERGFINIIYKDYRILQGMEAKAVLSIDNAFEQILNQNRLPAGRIDRLESNPLCAVIRDSAYIKEDTETGCIYAYIPASMLFTNEMENWIWSRVNFKTTFLTVQLYREFESGKASIKEVSRRYVQEFAKKGAAYLDLNTNGKWEEFVVSGRIDVFREMNDLFCLSPAFFVENAPYIDGNSGIGFELISSGKNRVAFLMAKGYKYIPAKISKEAYDAFINLEIVQEIEEYISREQMAELEVPVPHPFFYKYPSKAPDYYELWLERIGKDITEECFHTKHAFDVSQMHLKISCKDHGAAKRYFRMLGMDVCEDSEKNQLTMLLDQLFYYTECESGTMLEYDYAILYDRQDFLPMLECVSKVCYIAGQSVQLEKEMALVDRNKYDIELIFITFWDKREYSGYAIRKIGK